MAQLVEQSIPSTEGRGSNPAIDNFNNLAIVHSIIRDTLFITSSPPFMHINAQWQIILNFGMPTGLAVWQ